ncbi:hypothetical protein POKO110462_12905 [Pontibacter korlensis]|uniref:Rho-binding antiterminator n=1 Tax=Pontibacter korlensis TaxID=400092 RepID=A0A0E3UXZ9_9BACT|nr:hypothetical protein [Pontibacter korlensis]AKD04021.1 hypothetical protein PKOR_14110 [Pontibacter korlensis]
MSKAYKPIDPAFHSELEQLVAKRVGARLQFFTDIHEFITRFGTLKELVTRGEEEYLILSTGEEIRLDRIVRIDDKPAPGYDEEYFKCDIGR